MMTLIRINPPLTLCTARVRQKADPALEPGGSCRSQSSQTIPGGLPLPHTQILKTSEKKMKLQTKFKKSVALALAALMLITASCGGAGTTLESPAQPNTVQPAPASPATGGLPTFPEDSGADVTRGASDLVEITGSSAIQSLNGKDLNGRAMNVSEARPREERPGGGGGGGGFGGGRGGGGGGGRGG